MSGARLDNWLFHARFYRRRPLAQAAASAGKIRLNGMRVARPSHAIKPGDILTLPVPFGGRGAGVMAVRVLALAERRGPASAARNLYEVLE